MLAVSAPALLITASGTIYGLGNLSVSGAAGVVSGISGYLRVYGPIEVGPSLTAGVSCSGSPSGSFASINGVVTHC